MLARSKTSTIDTTKTLKWYDKTAYFAEFDWLCNHPPIHSVLVEIAPEVADDLLAKTNADNRNIRPKHAQIMARDMASGNYETTGDSIKFDTDGLLLDGQHRLKACADSGVTLTTHVVFGLAPKVFDSLDRGARRTASDVVAKAGYHNTHLLAATVTLLKRMESSSSLDGGWKGAGEALTPRDVLRLLKTEYVDLPRFANEALKVNTAFKYPPSVVLAVLYKIQRHDPKLAATFVAEWLTGARIGRNKAFDVLASRLLAMRQQSTTAISRTARLGLLIITFNHWHAGILLHPRSLSWKSKTTLPNLEFDGEAFASNRKAAEQIGTSLPQVQERILEALRPMAQKDKNHRAHMPWATLARASAVPANQLRYCIRTLMDDGHLSAGTVMGREHVTAYLAPTAFDQIEGAGA